MLTKRESRTDERTKGITLKNAVGVGTFMQNDGLPRVLKFVLNNSAGGTAKEYFLGDAVGLVEHFRKATPDAFNLQEVPHSMFQKMLQSNPVVFEALRLEAKVSKTQFANDLVIRDADYDGTDKAQIISLSESVDGSQYDALVQSYKFEISMGIRRALTLTVDAGETVTGILYLKAGLNRF